MAGDVVGTQTLSQVREGAEKESEVKVYALVQLNVLPPDDATINDWLSEIAMMVEDRIGLQATDVTIYKNLDDLIDDANEGLDMFAKPRGLDE
jgi:hypothetical protein